MSLSCPFDNRDSYIRRDDPSPPPLILKACMQQTGKHAICDAATFATRWRTFHGGALDNLDWSNLFAAGGSILACLLEADGDNIKDRDSLERAFSDSDIDLFVVGLTDPDAATAVLRRVAQTIERNTKKPVQLIRTHRAVTILGTFPVRHIQVILRLCKSGEEVLQSFDLDSCTAGYDGKQVQVLPRFTRALKYRYNLATEDRRSNSFESRLLKYAARGFAVALPKLDESRVDYEWIREQRGYWRKTGLARLMYEEARLRRFGGRRFGIWGMRAPAEEGANYGIHVPWSRWATNSSVKRSLNHTDQAQFFSSLTQAQRSLRAAGKSGTPTPVHRHLFVSGIDATDATKSDWCRLCKQKKHFDEQAAPFVPEVMVWESEHTDKQDFDHGFVRAQAGGASLQPVQKYWYEGVYKDEVDGSSSSSSSSLGTRIMGGVGNSSASTVGAAQGFQELEKAMTLLSLNEQGAGKRGSDASLASFTSNTLAQSWSDASTSGDLSAFGGPVGTSAPPPEPDFFSSNVASGSTSFPGGRSYVPRPTAREQFSSASPSSSFSSSAPLASQSSLLPPVDSVVSGSAAHAQAGRVASVLAKALVLITYFHRGGQLDDERKGRLKSLAMRGDAAILSAVEAFNADGDEGELLETWELRLLL